MNFHVLTLFPEMIMNGLNTSIIGRAMENELLHIEAINIRDYTLDKHRRVDDYPYGGGAGMVMQAEPIYKAYEALLETINTRNKHYLQDSKSDFINDGLYKTNNNSVHDIENNDVVAPQIKPRVVYVTPQGKVFQQEMAKDFAKEEDLIFLCGHYEGIDERVLELIVTDYVSIGDYVLTGGELPAMVMIDAISRHVPGVLNNETSAKTESFENNLLEYPQYTRPEEYMGKRVPEVLLSGHHAKIEGWRREQSLLRTKKTRPDLLEKAELSKGDMEILNQVK